MHAFGSLVPRFEPGMVSVHRGALIAVAQTDKYNVQCLQPNLGNDIIVADTETAYQTA